MALADPQLATIGTAQTLPRILTGTQSATYQTADGVFFLSVKHQVTKSRKNTLVQIGRKKVTTDPLTDVKTEIVATVNTVIARPLAGFTEAELLELLSGVAGWGSASTNANYKKVLGLES